MMENFFGIRFAFLNFPLFFFCNFQIEFLKLVDITHDMTEPCIIDIKIGKRTWDPLASEEKTVEEKVSLEIV